MLVNIQNMQLLRRNAVLLQKRQQMSMCPLCAPTPSRHQKNDASVDRSYAVFGYIHAAA
jgi:hypothetical protein